MKPSQKPSNPIRRAGRATGTPRTVRDMGLVAVLAIGMSACSTTLKVQTEVKPDTDFTRYHTFALLPLPAAVPATDPGLALRVTEPARQAVIQSLMTKGFKEAERAQADIV